MFRILIAVITLHLAAAGASPKPSTPADATPKSSWQQAPSAKARAYDEDAERRLLELANTDRARAGLPPLKMDDGLVRAARAHAAEMASQNQLSHQFPGEPSLIQRVSGNSSLHLSGTGENVAMAATAADAHHALMLSPPHRDNLLNAEFNVAGFAVLRSGDRLYVAQDFGSSLATLSVQRAQELVADTVEQLRAQAKMPRLQRVDNRTTQSSACAMAQSDSLTIADPPPGAYMLRYTSMQPETIPGSVSKVIAQRGLHTYSAGTCYARTQKYPNGAYWVVLIFY